jgi:hypothetical protein
MSGTGTTKLIKAYEQRIQRQRFFSSLFASPPENFHSTDKVEIDVIRQGQHVAIPVPDMDAGPRRMSMDDFVNKAFTPTVFNYDLNMSAANLRTREPGVDPYTDPVWATAATRRVFRLLGKAETMFRDGIEVMASQVMTTGQIALVDDGNNSVFALNFEPKDATGTLASGDLIVTVDTEWAADGSAGAPLTDCETLFGNVAAQGYDVTDVALGSTALQRFLKNPDVLTQLNLLRADFGNINPAGQPPGGGAARVGRMVIGGYDVRLWSYNATYLHPYTGTVTRYLPANKIVAWDASAPRDLTWGEIPLLPAAPGQQQLSFVPSRLSYGKAGMDFQVVAYVTQDRKNLVVNIGCRPLCIPTAIDSFACMTVHS